MSERIAITGVGIASPIGVGEASFWDALANGRSAAAPIDCLDTSELSRKTACRVREPIDVDAPVGRAAKLAIVAARQAGLDAGWSNSAIKAPRASSGQKIARDPISSADSSSIDNRQSTIDNSPRVSIIVGTTMGETDFIEDRITAPGEQWLNCEHMQRIVSGRPGSISKNVQHDLGLDGYASDLYGACAAGNMAIAVACRQLLDGQCDIAIAGGADGFSRLAFIGFMRARVMAAEVCRPFDEARDGLLVGEGSAMFVLERESDARTRGAKIRARVLGTALMCESYHPTRPDPDGDGLRRATMDALRRADLQASDIDYVCAHGTGTPHNDAIEIKVMQSCFPNGVPFSSIKALTGHPMGGAAAIEAAACILMLEKQTLIPTWHLEKPAACEPLDPLMSAPRPAKVRHILNNSAGFGGYNSSIILAA